jgi:arylsulfatase B
MFMYYAVHNTHSPVQAPVRIQALYANIDWQLQRVFNAMISTVDESAKNVTDALKSQGMWDNTLFIWCTGAGIFPSFTC